MPTQDNIARIAKVANSFIFDTKTNRRNTYMLHFQDLADGLYESYYLNFIAPIPRNLLENLASGALESNTQQNIAKVCCFEICFQHRFSFLDFTSFRSTINTWISSLWKTIFFVWDKLDEIVFHITVSMLRLSIERRSDYLISIFSFKSTSLTERWDGSDDWNDCWQSFFSLCDTRWEIHAY